MMERMQEAWGKLSDKIGNVIDATILLLPNILLSMLVAVIGVITVRFLQTKLKKILVRNMSNPTMATILSKVVAFVLMVSLLFLILGILNLDKLLTSLLATAGVLGLAVGLALQEPLANAFGGIMLSMRRLYNIGDLVETNDHFGVIKEVNLRSTIMHVPSGQVVALPNKMVLQNPIINFSYRGKRRVEVDCGVSYAEDLGRVEQIVREAMESVDYLEQEPLEFFYVEFAGSSINFRVRFWIKEVGQASYYTAKSTAMVAIKKAFDKHDISIPFPIRTLDFGIKGGKQLARELNNLSIVEGNRELAQDALRSKEN